ncbi:MAG TPA: metallophosphoesterase [Planctomycetota bacterium]|nr:metallophosphoesterase [Planctomycetota bacterium]
MSDRGGILREFSPALRERRLVLHFPGFPAALDGLKLCLVSDLHLRKPTPTFDELLSYLNTHTFDLACCTGDVAGSWGGTSAASLELARRLFQSSPPRLGWFAVRGNNDPRPFMRRLARMGVHVLYNEAVRIGGSDPPFYLVGVDDPHYGHDDLDAALRDVPQDAFKLLLAHSPDVIHNAARRRVELVLSGHTHGGQIRLPVIGAVLTQSRVGRRYAWGLARKGDTLIYTTCGVGWALVPVRFNCPPEVVSLTLRRGRGPHVDFHAPV